MKFRLVSVASGAGFELQQELVAGRLSECDIQLTKGLPSRRHARITRVDDAAWVEDLGSANGTYVNGLRIEARTRINPGDLIRFDVEEFRLLGDGSAVDVDAPTQFRASSTGAAAAAAQVSAQPGSSGVLKRPGAWVDPDSADGGQKTKFMDPALLRSAIDGAAKDAGASDAAADGPCLLVLSGSRKGTRVRLRPAAGHPADWSIGSGAECGIRFPEEGVSALHARLVNEGHRWKIVDQMSANGTYVNGKRATMGYLGGNDRIGVGPVECELLLPASRSAEPAAHGQAAGRSRGLWIIVSIVLLLAAVAAWWLM